MVTASGALSVPLDAVRTLLSGIVAFQTRLGVSSAAAALPSIHLYLAEEDDFETLPRPFALLITSDFVYGSPAADTFTGAGTIRIVLSDLPHEEDEDESYLDFANFVGDVADGLVDSATGVNTIFIDHTCTVRMAERPNRTPRRQRQSSNDYFRAVLDLTYGEGDE